MSSIAFLQRKKTLLGTVPKEAVGWRATHWKAAHVIGVLVACFFAIAFSFCGGQAYAANEMEAANIDTMAANTIRYSVLIVDTSGSMEGTPIEKEREAAIKFCETIMESDGINYVAIVSLNSYADVMSEFTTDIDQLKETVSYIEDGGGTNITDALLESKGLLDEIPDEDGVIKNIILCTDGLPESGGYSEEGRYTSDDSYDYFDYANVAYETAVSMWDSCNIYTLGFFHALEGEELAFGKRLLQDLQNAGYYEVDDPENLTFAFGDIASDLEETYGKTFYYDKGYQATCFYTDDYFRGSSFGYQASLATMSMCFALSAFGDATQPIGDYSHRSNYVEYMLKSVIGIDAENVAVNEWYNVKPEVDSIGAAIGSKKIQTNSGECTLIALAVRGGGYEREWGSNFTIGVSGQHSGFNRAKNNVKAFLQDYVKTKGITGHVKFWLTGYSRAAATANLLAGELVDGIDFESDINYDSTDVFAYCFEAPRGAIYSEVNNDSRYNCIYNIINPNDLVPYVAPRDLDFGRYGVDKFIPTRADYSGKYSKKRDNMLKIYNSLQSTGEYTVDSFRMKRINLDPLDGKLGIQDDYKTNYSQAVCLEQYVSILAKEFMRDRLNYVNNYQTEIREVCKVIFGCEGDQLDILLDSLTSQVKKEWPSFILAYGNSLSSDREAFKIVYRWLHKAISDAGVTDYSESTIKVASENLSELLIGAVASHPNYATTLALNFTQIADAHRPELCFSWLASFDKNYTKYSSSAFSGGAYRIIKINCDVNTKVYDYDWNLVASIEGDKINDFGDEGLLSGINTDGEQFVIMPADGSYNVSIEARSDCSVNVSLSEYSSQAGDFTRIVNYFDMQLEEGDALEAYIPSYSARELQEGATEGSSAEYEMYDAYYDYVPSDSDLTGEDAAGAYYTVEVASSDETLGTVDGSGLRQYGSFAQVSAQPKEGYAFAGWYDENGEKVSGDAVYRFCVTQDTKLTAHFQKAGKVKQRFTVSVGKAPKVKASKLRKAKRTVKCPIKVEAPDASKITYTKVKKKSSARLSINKKTGKITIKKKTKRGTYKIRVKVTAYGNERYENASKIVTVKIKVK